MRLNVYVLMKLDVCDFIFRPPRKSKKSGNSTVKHVTHIFTTDPCPKRGCKYDIEVHTCVRVFRT